MLKATIKFGILTMDKIVLQAFKELKQTNSNLDKEIILTKYKNNSIFIDLLKKNLDSDINYFISKMPDSKFITTNKPTMDYIEIYPNFNAMCNNLSKRIFTGNVAKEVVANFFKRIEDIETKELLQAILFKKAIGVGISTVNSVYGKNFIPKFECMLAPSKNADINNLTYPCYISPKLDGVRGIFVPEQGFLSRVGKNLPNRHLSEFFESLYQTKAYVVEGELWHPELDFNDIQSIVMSEDKQIPKGFRFNLFDCVPIDDWERQICNLSYEDRLKDMRKLVNGVYAAHKKIIDIPVDLVDNAGEVINFYKKHLQEGFEGSILRSVEGKYKWKRLTIKEGEVLKLKPFKSVDLKIVGIFDGEGELEGKAGGIIADYNGTSVRVGSGFSNAIRDSLSQQPSKYIGRTAEIKYFEKTEEGSLRHPTFTRFRDDK